MAAQKDTRDFAVNRKARRDYEVLDRIEAGIVLLGTEVKSIRGGHASLVGGFAKIEDKQIWLYSLNIPPYEHGNRFNHEADRPRQLLLHRREIRRLQAHTEQQGHALVPLRLYLKGGHVKVEIGICKGKRHEDKRDTLKQRTADREAARAMRQR
jgi:SsrA-binding protein